MTDTTAEQKLREIVEGLDGVTPAPWERVEKGVEKTIVEDPFGNELCLVPWYRERGYSAHRDAAHIASCDPDTIREIATAFEQLKRERDEAREIAHYANGTADANINQANDAEAEVARLKANNERLREALEWYESEAVGAAKALSSGKPSPDGALAVLTVLALDDGRRARTALENKP